MRTGSDAEYIRRRKADAITPAVIAELKRNLHEGDVVILLEKENAADGSAVKLKRTRWQIVGLYKHHMFLERKIKNIFIRHSISYVSYMENKGKLEEYESFQ